MAPVVHRIGTHPLATDVASLVHLRCTAARSRLASRASGPVAELALPELLGI